MTPPRRIGVNAVFLEPGMGGLETYVREVVPRLAAQAPGSRVTVVCNERGRALLAEEPWASDVELFVPRGITRPGLRAVGELTVLGAIASRRFDVLLNVALTAPLATRAANVVLLADITWLLFPDLADGDSVTARLWRTVVPTVARRADRVIALTHDGANGIVDRLGVAPGRVDVVPLGYGAPARVAPTPPDELRARLGLGPGPVVLNVAAKKVHKNLVVLVEAVARLRRDHPDVQLVLPGAPTPYEDTLRQRAAELGVAEAVSLPGFVDERDLEGLYALAACFALPSLNEGFGLPLLEAMGRDLPVVCANVSAMPEVVGDAALLFDPQSADAVAAAIARVLDELGLREEMVRRGHAQVARHSWEHCAALTLGTLQRAAATRGATD